MTDYIKREGAIKEFGADNQHLYYPFEVINRLRKIPAADVAEVRYGRWVMLSYDEAVCTRCGYNRNTPFDSTREARERWDELPPYCEMCGARMDGGEDNG